MENFDKNFTAALLEATRTRLQRPLNDKEIQVLSLRRSGVAYELMLDFITDERKTKTQIEDYLQSII